MILKPNIVSFETAKLLQEKGFIVNCQFLYVTGKYRIYFEKEGDLFNNGFPSIQKPIEWLFAPEHWQVFEWMENQHKIQVFPDYFFYDRFYYGIKFCKADGFFEEVFKENEELEPLGCLHKYEAAEYGIQYILKNHIKQ
jgi:hypothetical protein